MTFGEAEKWSVIASGEGAGGNGVRGSSPVSPVTSRCISYSSPPCPKSWPSIIPVIFCSGPTVAFIKNRDSSVTFSLACVAHNFGDLVFSMDLFVH